MTMNLEAAFWDDCNTQVGNIDQHTRKAIGMPTTTVGQATECTPDQIIPQQETMVDDDGMTDLAVGRVEINHMSDASLRQDALTPDLVAESDDDDDYV